MKMAYIVNLRIPTEKAYGYQICKMCEEFAKKIDNVELLVPNRTRAEDVDLFSYYGLENIFIVRRIKIFYSKIVVKYSEKLNFLLGRFTFFIKLFFKRKSDKKTIIYTRSPEIAWLASLLGRTILYEAHSWPAGKNKLYKFFLKKVDLIICNSKGTENEYKDRGFSSTMVAPNGVDLQDFNIDEDADTCRTGLKLPKDKTIIMYVGHLYKWKGAEMLIDAAEKLVDKNEIQFVLVGGYPADIQNFQEKIDKKNLQNISLLGHVNKKLIPKFLKSADVLVLPNFPISKESEKHTSPIKMFEYMASRRPIIASDLPSIKEVLNNNNSVLFRAGSCDDFVKELETLLADSDKSEKIINQAYQDAKHFTWEKRAENILKHTASIV